MQQPKTHRQFRYRRSPDQDATTTAHHPVVVIGAGPIGQSLAIDLAQRGIAVVLLDDSDRIGDGSRAICFSKRTLEIFDRLGVAAPMLGKGVEWRKGRVFHRDRELYSFDLLPEPGHKMPAFINLQQYYAEEYLIERATTLEHIDIRWRNRVTNVTQTDGVAELTIDTPDGPYLITADWVVACDGARSPTRGMLGLAFEGEQFEDQFLIADVKMTAAFPTERWFWFEPPFHNGQSALLHKQPDDVWRIDLQLSADADSEYERRPEVVRPRIARMLGHDDFELEWISIYRFQCRRLKSFVHGRVIFAGDSAHQVSPFGARGANSGIQDAENLAWKLALVTRGDAPASLLGTYDTERSEAADENILNSTRATDFIAPHSPAEMSLRNAALALAGRSDFAKRFVNPGRLSLPTSYADSPLSTPDVDTWGGGPRPGAPLPDAPLRAANGESIFLTDALGSSFTLIAINAEAPEGLADDVAVLPVGRDQVFTDADGLVERRFDGGDGAFYLVRPDSHIAARWRTFDPAQFNAALARAKGGSR
ncbi:MAG TPA: FAD-dependent oxidoreductase [Hyphomicrobiaceae bacterium]|nr:FAD-dependent oxidoreductase [Hyphomicrobiaceae bacterium]